MKENDNFNFQNQANLSRYDNLVHSLQEYEEEIASQNNSAKEIPNLPDEKVLTINDVSINELLDAYYKGKAVEFPSWIKKEEKLKISSQELFIHIIDNYHILSVKLGNSKGIVLYMYADGYYKPWTESDWKAFIKSFLPRKIREPRDWEKVYKELLTETVNTEESDLNSNEDIINFKNGILNISTGELLPHNPNYLCTIQIPCDYKPNVSLSRANVTMRFLEDITGGNVEDKATILEYIGAVISNINGSRFKKFLVLKGKGNTGKSVLLDLAIYLVGLENTYTTDIKKLHTQFGLAGAYGKRLICCGDMKFASISEIDKIKELTGNDYVNIEAKYQNSFTSKFHGLMWFNCNDLPQFSGDKGEHVYNRFLILSCDNVIPPEKRDAELLDKLKKESDILVSVAIKFLIMAKENEYKFTESERTIANRKNYEIENNSLSLFLNSCCVVGDGKTTTKEFKQQYLHWCRENKLTPEKPNNISRILVNNFGVRKFKSNTDYYELTINEI